MGEIIVARGEYTSTRRGEDIPGKGEGNTTRGESGPVGDRSSDALALVSRRRLTAS
jgi:hypothetical protein